MCLPDMWGCSTPSALPRSEFAEKPHLCTKVGGGVAPCVGGRTPHPYNTAHDRLMRQYDPECTMKKIVGCTRHLPVVDRNGRHSQVYLTIEERRDPEGGLHVDLFLVGGTVATLVAQPLFLVFGFLYDCQHILSCARSYKNVVAVHILKGVL